jgi:hypothetical protein
VAWNFCFDTTRMFVPMALAVGLNALIGWFEHIVAPWQAEIAGRDQNQTADS